jgi:hypothetical protein
MTDEPKVIEVIEPKKTKKQEKKLAVRVIASNEGSSLVEYLKDGEVKRCYLPSTEVINDEASPDMLEAGVDYGADLSGIVSQEVVYALHNYGIWTKSDILGNREQLLNALSAALIRPALEQLTEFAGK